MTPRRKPPWWPDEEPWPPSGMRGYRGGPWGRGGWERRHGPPLLLRFGCALIVLAVLVGGTLAVLGSVVSSVLGNTGAPPIGVGFLVVLFVLTLLVAFGAVRGFARMSAPLDEMADAAERIERGDYTTRVSEAGPRRMRVLARAFNEMSGRLATTDRERRAFLADAAHELRTPLSIIGAQLEAIEDGLYPADAEHLAPVHEQLQVLEQLIDDMRTVALADAGALPLNIQPIDLGTPIDHVVAAFQPQASSRGVVLTAGYAPSLPRATADEQRVRQVLTNLVANALAHTASGGHVTVAARPASSSTEGHVEVSVSDDGSGIAPELLPHVFDRFAKDDGSGGTGLGLAICRDLVEAMGGHINIESAAGRGTTVTFTLPVA
jgi:two-component system, OmpR family, sensor histidine kinase BaeS